MTLPNINQCILEDKNAWSKHTREISVYDARDHDISDIGFHLGIKYSPVVPLEFPITINTKQFQYKC